MVVATLYISIAFKAPHVANKTLRLDLLRSILNFDLRWATEIVVSMISEYRRLLGSRNLRRSVHLFLQVSLSLILFITHLLVQLPLQLFLVIIGIESAFGTAEGG